MRKSYLKSKLNWKWFFVPLGIGGSFGTLLVKLLRNFEWNVFMNLIILSIAIFYFFEQWIEAGKKL